ncbi:MAG: hypothetical protein RR356_02575 [Bacteroidales bacterium]
MDYILVLVSAPHFSPQTLDWFLFENTVIGPSYSEFGGIKNNRNFPYCSNGGFCSGNRLIG